MNTEKLKTSGNKQAAGLLAAIAIGVGLSGCSEGKITYRPMRMPEGAIYLGINDSKSGRQVNDASGKSFLINALDAERAYCGHGKQNLVMGEDDNWSPDKEIQILSNGNAQITCHDSSSNFPVEYFETSHPVIVPKNDSAMHADVAEVSTPASSGGIQAP